MAVVALVACGCGGSRGFENLEMGPRRATFSERLELRRLPNGLKLLFVPDARTNLVTIGVNYAVGSGDDPHDDHGLAHYVEHVMFDATPRARRGEPLAKAALVENAVTMLDRTYFYASALDVHAPQIVEAAARRLEVTCDDLDDAVLARERDVVIEETKYRAVPRGRDALLRAIWGALHPNGRGSGVDFADVPRERLCRFMDAHYGPASAVVVVAGNVRQEDYDRITARFAGIAARPAAKRVLGWTPKPGLERVTVSGLTKPTVMIVIPVPPEGSTHDAAIATLAGVSFRVKRGSASVGVVGEERARALVVSAVANDVHELPDLERDVREKLASLDVPELADQVESLRARAAAKLDDVFETAFELSTQVARGQRPTRFATLAALDAVTKEQLEHLLRQRHVRTIYALPEIGVPAHFGIADLATSLHDVDLSRTMPPALDDVTFRPSPLVHDYKLGNGLRVLLAPDPDSMAIAAKIVIAGAGGAPARDVPAMQAAMRLVPRDAASESQEAARAVAWYSTIAVPVEPDVGRTATTFGVSGFHLFGDWHVWWLAWNVLRGRYWTCEAACRTWYEAPRDDIAAASVVARRLAGAPGVGLQGKAMSPGALESYRRNTYRPESSTLIVSGKFDVAAMRREIDELFGSWRGDGAVARTMTTDAMPGHVVLATDDVSTVELSLAFSAPGMASGRDWVARAIVGEMLDDQVRAVRERLGASYGVHATGSTGALWIDGHVDPAHVREATRTIATAIARVRTSGPELADSFARARARVLARTLAHAGASTRAAALTRIALARSSVAELDREIEILRTIDLSTIGQYAARWLEPSRIIAVARGKLEPARAALVELGADTTRIEVHDIARAKQRGGGNHAEPAAPIISSADS